MANENEEYQPLKEELDERTLERCDDMLDNPESAEPCEDEIEPLDTAVLLEAKAVPKSVRKQNKIINNSYKNGTNLKGDEYRFDASLKVDATYADMYLDDIYEMEKYIARQRVQEAVMAFVDNTPVLKDMCSMEGEETKKFNREKINLMFGMICKHFEDNADIRTYKNVIYIFDNISYLSKLRYHNLFDMLDDDYKQKLIIELDKTHDILRSPKKNNKLF